MLIAMSSKVLPVVCYPGPVQGFHTERGCFLQVAAKGSDTHLLPRLQRYVCLGRAHLSNTYNGTIARSYIQWCRIKAIPAAPAWLQGCCDYQ